MKKEKKLPNLNLSREITEKFFSYSNPRLGKEAFYMFSVSKFILLKEKIIKKDSVKKILYFDNIKNKRYLPIILEFYIQILKSGIYKKNNMVIKYKNNDIRTEEIDNAIWCFNKIRDALAHGNYHFDFKHKSIIIDNVAQDNSYLLKCALPIDLLNSFTFFVEEVLANSDLELSEKRYKSYIDKMSKNFDIDKSLYYNYYKNYYNIDDKRMINNKIIDNKKINYNINNYSYKDNNLIITKKNYYDKGEKVEQIETKNDYEAGGVLESILNLELHKLSINELCKLANLLIMVKPKNKKEKEKIIELLNEFKKLLIEYNEKIDKEFDKKTEKLIDEMKSILGVKKTGNNSDGIISLYNYMSLVFSQIEKIDYSRLKLHSMVLEFGIKDKTEGIAVNYYNTIESIKRKCVEFNSKISSHITSYSYNKSENYRHSLMDIFAKFYTEIIESIGNRNEYIIDSVRNAIEHGNYMYHKKGYIVMYDQTDHNDDQSIKFVAAINPNDLFDISKQIESSGNNNYIIKDFVQELSTIIGNELFEELWNNLDALSNIIFGKDLNINYTIENMYHEALAIILSTKIK